MKKLIYALSLCTVCISICPKIAMASWCIEEADAQKLFSRFSPRAIAVDKSNNPHIAYGEYHLYYAYYDGSIWLFETADRKLWCILFSRFDGCHIIENKGPNIM